MHNLFSIWALGAKSIHVSTHDSQLSTLWIWIFGATSIQAFSIQNLWIWAFGAKSIQTFSLQNLLILSLRGQICTSILTSESFEIEPFGASLYKQSRFSIFWFWDCGAKSTQATSLRNLSSLSLLGQINTSILASESWIWAIGAKIYTRNLASYVFEYEAYGLNLYKHFRFRSCWI